MIYTSRFHRCKRWYTLFLYTSSYQAITLCKLLLLSSMPQMFFVLEQRQSHQMNLYYVVDPRSISGWLVQLSQSQFFGFSLETSFCTGICRYMKNLVQECFPYPQVICLLASSKAFLVIQSCRVQCTRIVNFKHGKCILMIIQSCRLNFFYYMLL